MCLGLGIQHINIVTCFDSDTYINGTFCLWLSDQRKTKLFVTIYCSFVLPQIVWFAAQKLCKFVV